MQNSESMFLSYLSEICSTSLLRPYQPHLMFALSAPHILHFYSITSAFLLVISSSGEFPFHWWKSSQLWRKVQTFTKNVILEAQKPQYHDINREEYIWDTWESHEKIFFKNNRMFESKV